MLSLTGRRWRLIHDGEEFSRKTLNERMLEMSSIKDERQFFSPDFHRDIYDPSQLLNIDEALEAIEGALEDGSKIAVFGDYDVDGLTGAAVLIETLKNFKADVATMVPNRLKDGYGLSLKAIDAAAQYGIKLMITVDCGISNKAEIAYAKELGIGVIVCDHHQIPVEMPNDAIALIHPLQEGDNYPFKGLTGVGVAYKLSQALYELRGEMDAEEKLTKLLDLVAMGTLADQGDLEDENRTLVSLGLKQLSKRERPGIAALLNVAGIRDAEITEEHVAFQISPRINAAGRMASPMTAIRLLLADNIVIGKKYADELQSLNDSRKQRTVEIMREIMQELHSNKPKGAVVLSNPNWSVGLLGLLASRVVESFNLPTVLLEDRGDHLIASARSIPGFDVHAALAQSRELFEKFGGHEQAAGLTISKDNFQKFKKDFITSCTKPNSKDEPPELELAMRLNQRDVTIDSAKIIRKFGPFGKGYPVPHFLIEKADIVEIVPMGDGSHLRIMIKIAEDQSEPIALTAFRFGKYKEDLLRSKKISAAVRILSSRWQGKERVELHVEDIRAN